VPQGVSLRTYNTCAQKYTCWQFAPSCQRDAPVGSLCAYIAVVPRVVPRAYVVVDGICVTMLELDTPDMPASASLVFELGSDSRLTLVLRDANGLAYEAGCINDSNLEFSAPSVSNPLGSARAMASPPSHARLETYARRWQIAHSRAAFYDGIFTHTTVMYKGVPVPTTTVLHTRTRRGNVKDTHHLRQRVRPPPFHDIQVSVSDAAQQPVGGVWLDVTVYADAPCWLRPCDFNVSSTGLCLYEVDVPVVQQLSLARWRLACCVADTEQYARAHDFGRAMECQLHVCGLPVATLKLQRGPGPRTYIPLRSSTRMPGLAAPVTSAAMSEDFNVFALTRAQSEVIEIYARASNACAFELCAAGVYASAGAPARNVVVRNASFVLTFNPEETIHTVVFALVNRDTICMFSTTGQCISEFSVEPPDDAVDAAFTITAFFPDHRDERFFIAFEDASGAHIGVSYADATPDATSIKYPLQVLCSVRTPIIAMRCVSDMAKESMLVCTDACGACVCTLNIATDEPVLCTGEVEECTRSTHSFGPDVACTVQESVGGIHAWFITTNGDLVQTETAHITCIPTVKSYARGTSLSI
jgi:hypothetical protein